ncbi:PAS domain S-box-containing protein [Spirosoma oryzae]|uniref:histidine kinase n=1 Tax=Spirosoma oryzae TaxID=1469603 RepID=A0A2T0RXP0_9BACT|nr:ATP-binding protein [Spirosoma oryzae]PRY25902.1 PAS domain S-box-containing protein [Spirosoma oryzae]
MNQSPVPPLATNRVEALHSYHILDSAAEADYDNIAQLAAQLCQTPIAQINFIDQTRQWVKANRGFTTGSTPIDESFCGHTILDPLNPLIVEDARLDARFAHNPLVNQQANIVFYAGLPLVDPGGFALGSLCVLDQRPRQLTTEQLDALRILAGQVVNLLVLRKANHDLKALLVSEQQSRAEVQTQRQLHLAAAESEVRFRALIEEAPVATMLLAGPDHVITLANPAMIEMLGKGPTIVGQPAVQAVPELATQPYLHLLNQVFALGLTHQARAMPGEIVINGQPSQHYFDFTYKPLRDSAGQPYGILCVAVDVTEQFMARQQLEQATDQLRSMVESAPFPIGVYTGRQMLIRFANQAIIDVYGKGPDVIGKSYLELLPELADQQIFAQLLAVYDSGIPFASGTQRVMIEHDGRLVPYYFNYNFTPLFDANGQVYGVMNTAAEVTELELARQALEASEGRYRLLAAHLEEQVQLRTQELATVNNVLATSNRELTASNERTSAVNSALSESNHNLSRSNNNLEQFAYIASHDLQEPLRKIQQFGDLLQSQYGGQLGEGIRYLERMQAAAARMATLIRDLLTFSRIATQRNSAAPVSLQGVVEEVLLTLDWSIQEVGAQVEVDSLPTVAGDALQLEQLFQNLLSNALKFRRGGTSPLIEVRASLLDAADLPADIKPDRVTAQYHRIEVIDNGVGFEEKYLDRIFQVFQRLHNKSEFTGTGIGLAICEKVVTNHGGAITARSQPGQGTTFMVYLPG